MKLAHNNTSSKLWDSEVLILAEALELIGVSVFIPELKQWDNPLRKIASILEFSTSAKLMLMLIGTMGLPTEMLGKYDWKFREWRLSKILGGASHTLPCLYKWFTIFEMRFAKILKWYIDYVILLFYFQWKTSYILERSTPVVQIY